MLAEGSHHTGFPHRARPTLVRGYAAHREHYCRRLVRQGWDHRAVTVLCLSIAAFLGWVTVACYGYGMIAPFTFIGLIVLPWVGIVLLVRWAESRPGQRPARPV